MGNAVITLVLIKYLDMRPILTYTLSSNPLGVCRRLRWGEEGGIGDERLRSGRRGVAPSVMA